MKSRLFRVGFGAAVILMGVAAAATLPGWPLDHITFLQGIPHHPALPVVPIVCIGLVAAGITVALTRHPWSAIAAIVATMVATTGEFLLLSGSPPLGTGLLIGGTLLAAGVLRARFTSPGARPPAIRDHSGWIFLFVSILLVAALVRCYRIDTFEQRLCFSHDSTIDVAYKGEWAMDFLAGRPYTAFILHWGERETLYIYLESLLILLFGQNLMSLTVLSIASGVLTVLLTIWLGRRLFDLGTGLTAGLLLAVSPWLIATNRISERFNFVPLFTVVALLTTVKALQDGRWWRSVTAGAWLGIGLYTFPSYRVVPIIALVAWGSWIAFERGRRRSLLLFMPLYWLAFALVALAPLKFSITEFMAHFVLAREHGFKMYKHVEDIFNNGRLLFTSFHLRFWGDMSYSSQRPLLHPLLGVALLVGLWLFILRLKRKETLFSLAWLLIGLLPVIVSDPVPRRMGVSLPVIYLLAASGLLALCRRLTENRSRWSPLLAGGLTAAVIVPIAATDLAQLFTVDYCTGSERVCELYRMEEYVRTVGPYFQTFTTHMGEYQQLLKYYKHSSADDHNDYEKQVINPMDQIPLHKQVDRDVLLVIGPQKQHQRAIPLLEEYYPKATRVDHRAPDGRIMFTSLFIGRDDMAVNQGLLLELGDGGGHGAARIDREMGFAAGVPTDVPIPCNGRWRGSFFLPQSGVVSFALVGEMSSVVTVDGERIGRKGYGAGRTDVQRFLFKGMHDLEIGFEAVLRTDRLVPGVIFPGMGYDHLPPEYFMPFPTRRNELAAPPCRTSTLQYVSTGTFTPSSPYTNAAFTARQLAIGHHGERYLADPDTITIGCYTADGALKFAFTPLSDPVERWESPREFNGERNRELLIRTTGQGELLVVDQTRGDIHCFDLEGNRLWKKAGIDVYIQRLINNQSSTAVWMLAGGRLHHLDEPSGAFSLMPELANALTGYYEINAACANPERDLFYFYDGAFEKILSFDREGRLVSEIHNLGRQDNPRLDILPDGSLLFCGLRSHNVHAISAAGECLLGRIGNPPRNILGCDTFEMISDMMVGNEGRDVYLVFYSGIVQHFSRMEEER
ncbi:glycosyltransferase family 39 protein [bacterium]|nr:glycosyltransferase family 39 protein [candidate division CSSED10-310 bacterium]